LTKAAFNNRKRVGDIDGVLRIEPIAAKGTVFSFDLPLYKKQNAPGSQTSTKKS